MVDAAETLAAVTPLRGMTYAETQAMLIDNVKARIAQVRAFRNDAYDLKAAADAVNALIAHIQAGPPPA